jgi:hypothetical protein
MAILSARRGRSVAGIGFGASVRREAVTKPPTPTQAASLGDLRLPAGFDRSHTRSAYPARGSGCRRRSIGALGLEDGLVNSHDVGVAEVPTQGDETEARNAKKGIALGVSDRGAQDWAMKTAEGSEFQAGHDRSGRGEQGSSRWFSSTVIVLAV